MGKCARVLNANEKSYMTLWKFRSLQASPPPVLYPLAPVVPSDKLSRDIRGYPRPGKVVDL